MSDIEKALVEISNIITDIHKLLGVSDKDSVSQNIISQYRNGTVAEYEIQHLETLIWLGQQGEDVLRWMILVGDVDQDIRASTYDVAAMETILNSNIIGYMKSSES